MLGVKHREGKLVRVGMRTVSILLCTGVKGKGKHKDGGVWSFRREVTPAWLGLWIYFTSARI